MRGLASPVSAGLTVPGARSGQIPPPGSVPVAGVRLLACGSRAGMGSGQRPGPWDSHVWPWPPLAPPFSGVGACPHPRPPLPSPGPPWTDETIKASVPGPRALWTRGRCQQLGHVGGAPEDMCPQAPCSVRGVPGSPACCFFRSRGSGRLVPQLRVGTEAVAPELDSLGPRSGGVGAWGRRQAAGSPRPGFVPEAPPSVAR